MKSSDEGGKDLVPWGQGASKAITQSGNKAKGHIAAGNVNDTTVYGDVNLNLPQPHRESALGRLYRKLVEEADGDQELTEYIAELQIFTRTVEHGAIVGLDGKFHAANRDDQLDMAKAMKEVIYGELRKNMFSKTFQTIYATLMGKIYEEFQTWIIPLIANNASRAEIDVAINQKVVQPIVSELENCDHFDGVANSTVRGMLYFLTGNCHLVWH